MINYTYYTKRYSNVFDRLPLHERKRRRQRLPLPTLRRRLAVRQGMQKRTALQTKILDEIRPFVLFDAWDSYIGSIRDCFTLSTALLHIIAFAFRLKWTLSQFRYCCRADLTSHRQSRDPLFLLIVKLCGRLGLENLSAPLVELRTTSLFFPICSQDELEGGIGESYDHHDE